MSNPYEQFRTRLEMAALNLGVMRREDREDLVQEAMVKAWQASWDPNRSALYTWLRTQLGYAVLEWRRRYFRLGYRLDAESLSLDALAEQRDRGRAWEPAAPDDPEADALDSVWLERFAAHLGGRNPAIVRLVAEGYSVIDAAREAGGYTSGNRIGSLRKRLRVALSHREE